MIQDAKNEPGTTALTSSPNLVDRPSKAEDSTMSSKSKADKVADSSVGQVQQPKAKKARKDTSNKNTLVEKDYISAWTDTTETHQELATANSLFGAKNAWFCCCNSVAAVVPAPAESVFTRGKYDPLVYA
jgi:hypothetical protein